MLSGSNHKVSRKRQYIRQVCANNIFISGHLKIMYTVWFRNVLVILDVTLNIWL